VSDFAIRNWAFFAGVLLAIAFYITGRVDQRRHDLKTIKRLRATVKECDQLLVELNDELGTLRNV